MTRRGLAYGLLYIALGVAVGAVALRAIIPGLIFEGDLESIYWTAATVIAVCLALWGRRTRARMTADEFSKDGQEAARDRPKKCTGRRERSKD